MVEGACAAHPGRRTDGPAPAAGRTGMPVLRGDLGGSATNGPFPGRLARDGRGALLPWRRLHERISATNRGPSPSTSAAELQPYGSVSSRWCKISYRRTAAAALTL